MIAYDLKQLFYDIAFGRQRQQAFGPRRPSPSRSAAINRWTGKPHEHSRERSRRLARMRKGEGQ